MLLPRAAQGTSTSPDRTGAACALARLFPALAELPALAGVAESQGLAMEVVAEQVDSCTARATAAPQGTAASEDSGIWGFFRVSLF